jgi:hypothetical protein
MSSHGKSQGQSRAGTKQPADNSIYQSNYNTVLSYQTAKSGALFQAGVRVSKLAISYQLVSTESQARRTRGFYPHRRALGNFVLQIDSIHWQEHQALMHWFRAYTDAALNSDGNMLQPPAMWVQCQARNFRRSGVPVGLFTFGDHIGSNVFSPAIQFLSARDPGDPQSTMIFKQGASATDYSDTATLAVEYFYPDSRASYPGSADAWMYGYGQPPDWYTLQHAVDPGTATTADEGLDLTTTVDDSTGGNLQSTTNEQVPQAPSPTPTVPPTVLLPGGVITPGEGP